MSRILGPSAALFGVCLSASTAAGFPVVSGGKANDVVGQADYATGFVDFAVDPFFGGGTSRTRMFVPADVAYDAANERVFVADVHNHRFLVFDASSGLPAGAPAVFVLGQPDFVTGGADGADPYGHSNTQNPAAGCTTAINACGVARAYAVAYDDVHDRLFAADPDNHRVLVWDLSAGIANGMAARWVIGQANFTGDARNSACGGNGAGTVGACGLAFPSELAYDAPTGRLYVADTDNHRVVVFDLSAGITNGMAATAVLGQPNLTTATANTACGGGSAGVIGTCGLDAPAALAFDPAGRLFVGDGANHRVMMFSTTALVSGAAATRVLGQPGFTSGTPNTACGGGSSGEQNTNACGFGTLGFGLEYDDANDRLYVADTANHRILSFDVATVQNGESAVGVMGQGDYASGYDPSAAALGGATSRSELTMPFGLAYDPINDRLIAADGGNHRLMVFGSNVGGQPVAIAGDDVSASTVQSPNGTTTIGITTSVGDAFGVVLPPGTQPLPGSEDITITVDNQNGATRPRIRIDALLPPGTTKTVTLPRSTGLRLCIVDKTHAEIIQDPSGACAGNLVNGPSTGGFCNAYTVDGDPGDNGDPVRGRHTVRVCLNTARTSYTLTGLLHSAVGLMPAQPDDELTPPDDEEAVEDEPQGFATGGCDAGGGGGAGLLAAAMLAAFGLWITGRARSRATSAARAPRTRRRAARRAR